MKDVIKTTTKGGENPKWIHKPTEIDVYYSKSNGSKSTKGSLYIHHKQLPAWELTESDSDKKYNNHEVYLRAVTISNYGEVFSGYMNQIEMLHEMGLSPVEIITKIYGTEKNTKETEMEVETLKTAFKKVNHDFQSQLEIVTFEMSKLEEIKEEMELICKQMEML